MRLSAHVSSMASFAIYRSMSLASPWKVGDMLAHTSAIRQSPAAFLQAAAVGADHRAARTGNALLFCA